MQQKQVQIATGLFACVKEAFKSVPSWVWRIFFIFLMFAVLPVIIVLVTLGISSVIAAIGALAIPLAIPVGVAGLIKLCAWLLAIIAGLKIFFQKRGRR